MATTRSSPSLTADPKDFVLGNFESCGATLATTPQDGTATADSLSPLTDTNDNDIPDIQIGTGAAGGDIKDAAVLSVTGTTSFTETVPFHVCGPISTGTCDTGGVSAGSQAANANGTYVSDSVNLTEAGRYCWRGDGRRARLASRTAHRIAARASASRCSRSSRRLTPRLWTPTATR